MTWNYRVMRRVEDGDNLFGIHEVYYDPKFGTDTWTGNCSPGGETLEELKSDLKLMLEALDRPVLDNETGEPVKGGRKGNEICSEVTRTET